MGNTTWGLAGTNLFNAFSATTLVTNSLSILVLNVGAGALERNRLRDRTLHYIVNLSLDKQIADAFRNLQRQASRPRHCPGFAV